MSAFAKKIIIWQRREGRHGLPWQGTRDAYRIWLSEIMLQQTQVATVIPYYEKFVARFPDVAALAAANLDDVMQLWAGLGYYARARTLHALARQVTGEHDGIIPSEPVALRELPGVGAYTAGAVASFAYEKRAALVDTNVARVLHRVFAPGITPKSGAGSKVLWAIAQRLLPRTGKLTWTHNQALMELGALVCTARAPTCGVCPVRSVCKSADSFRA